MNRLKQILIAAIAVLAITAAPAAANSVVAFGLDFHYELGPGYKQYAVTQPIPVAGLLEAAQLSGGQSTGAAVLANGDALVWGGNSFGQDGNGRQWIPEPSPHKILSGVSQISAGGGNGLALMQDGTVDIWGSDGYGQLLDGFTGGGTEAGAIKYASATPKPVPGLGGKVVQVVSFAGTQAVLLADGTILGWGEDGKGQIGLPLAKEVTAPRPIAGLSGVVEIAAGGTAKYESVLLARKADGSVWSLGVGTRGQRGDGTQSSSGTPSQVKGLPAARAIAASRSNGAAVSTTGQLYTWGFGLDGALGYPPPEHCIKANPVPCSTTAHPVTGMSEVTSFDAGYQTLYAVNAGTLYAWGTDEWGQLGNGSQTAASKPELILQGAVKVAAENYGALVETNATTRPPVKIAATASTSTSITVSWNSPHAGEVFNVGLQVCTGGPKERSTKATSIGHTTAHSRTVMGLLPGHEYEVSVGGKSFARSTVRARTHD
jgi:alpha-tubulin suppressor-like RCC1 family protein